MISIKRLSMSARPNHCGIVFYRISAERHRIPKTRVLVSKIADVDWIITDSEVEALLLENNLIKQHAPRYNVMLKDDKSYPYIRITDEPFPRVFSTRNVVRDGARYFGPYTDSRHIKKLLRTIYRIFPVRTCNKNIEPAGTPMTNPVCSII
ncbi:MAG: hypothetical protein U5N56_04140 [Candidatus Marinimicrobia bacterium]|nr:hypothetical protein [Candidatus Neomarinimicrobiota bacterium]